MTESIRPFQLDLQRHSIAFPTTISARYWLCHCTRDQLAGQLRPLAQELYRRLVCPPFMAKFVVFAKRLALNEAQLRLFCATDDKEERTLEEQEHFRLVARSRDVEVNEGQRVYLELGGNLLALAANNRRGHAWPKSSAQLMNEQPSFVFRSFQENRLALTVGLRELQRPATGRVAFMEDSIRYLASLSHQQRDSLYRHCRRAICALALELPALCLDEAAVLGTPRRNSRLASARVGELSLAEVARALELGLKTDDEEAGGSLSGDSLQADRRPAEDDWRRLAPRLGIPRDEVELIAQHCHREQSSPSLLLLVHWHQLAAADSRDQDLARGLASIGRRDLADRLGFPVEPKKMSRSTMELLREIDLIPVQSHESLYANSSELLRHKRQQQQQRGNSLGRLDADQVGGVSDRDRRDPVRSSSRSALGAASQHHRNQSEEFEDESVRRISTREWTENRNGATSHMVEQTTLIESSRSRDNNNKKQRRRRVEFDDNSLATMTQPNTAQVESSTTTTTTTTTNQHQAGGPQAELGKLPETGASIATAPLGEPVEEGAKEERMAGNFRIVQGRARAQQSPELPECSGGREPSSSCWQDAQTRRQPADDPDPDADASCDGTWSWLGLAAAADSLATSTDTDTDTTAPTVLEAAANVNVSAEGASGDLVWGDSAPSWEATGCGPDKFKDLASASESCATPASHDDLGEAREKSEAGCAGQLLASEQNGDGADIELEGAGSAALGELGGDGGGVRVRAEAEADGGAKDKDSDNDDDDDCKPSESSLAPARFVNNELANTDEDSERTRSNQQRASSSTSSYATAPAYQSQHQPASSSSSCADFSSAVAETLSSSTTLSRYETARSELGVSGNLEGSSSTLNQEHQEEEEEAAAMVALDPASVKAVAGLGAQDVDMDELSDQDDCEEFKQASVQALSQQRLDLSEALLEDEAIDEDQLRRILACKRLSDGCTGRFGSSFLQRKNSLHMIEELPPLTEGEAMKHQSYHLSQTMCDRSDQASTSSHSSGSQVARRPQALGMKRGSQEESCSSSTSLERSPSRRRSSTVSQCSSVLSEGARNQLNFDLSPDLAPDSSLLEANALGGGGGSTNQSPLLDSSSLERPPSPEPRSPSELVDERAESRLDEDQPMRHSPMLGTGDLERLTRSAALVPSSSEKAMEEEEDEEDDGRQSAELLERLISDVSSVVVSSAGVNNKNNNKQDQPGKRTSAEWGPAEEIAKRKSLLPRPIQHQHQPNAATCSASPAPSSSPSSSSSSSSTIRSNSARTSDEAKRNDERRLELMIKMERRQEVRLRSRTPLGASSSLCSAHPSFAQINEPTKSRQNWRMPVGHRHSGHGHVGPICYCHQPT